VFTLTRFRIGAIIGLTILACASFIAVLYLGNTPVTTEVNSLMATMGSPYLAPGWNVTQLGTVSADGVGNDVLYNGSIVFWRSVNSTDFTITEFNLSTGTSTILWNSNGTITGSYGDIKVINDTVFASYGFALPGLSLFNTTVIDSSDLSNWATYCFSSTLSAESLGEYTGPGPYSGMLMYGGYSGDTLASIRAWNSTSGKEIDVFDGTFYGSDDACFLTMFNSTCMISGDCAPSNIIYTNDGGNWTDEYSPDYAPAYTQTFPFTWGWAVYVNNGTAYVAEECSAWQDTGPLAPIYDGGVMTWSGPGTTKPFDYKGMIMESISYELVGGSAGIFATDGQYGGKAVVFQYNADGSKGPMIWQGNYDGTVKDLTYVPESGTWYAIAYSNSGIATILQITKD
jgi:hypothetical protein